MRLASSLLVLACLVGCSRPQPAETQSAAKPRATSTPAGGEPGRATGTHLTVYSGDYERLSVAGEVRGDAPGFVLVERELQYRLEAGSNRIRATGLPRTMDAESATLRPRAGGVGVMAQRYIAAPRSSQDVVAAALGRRVAVEHTAGGAKQTDSGMLVSASGGLTLALADGRVKVIREYDNFSVVDGASLLPRQAALQWTVQAARAGDARFGLSYSMGGMAWRAEYLATLEPGDGCRLDLDGAAMVANRSGANFDQARLTLVAGEPNRAREALVVAGARMQYEAADAAPAPAPMPAQRVSGEYHAYELPGSFSLSSGGTERVPLFERLQGVACERAYETAPEVAIWDPPQPLLEPGFNNQTGAQPVKATVTLRNDAASGLGRPLPAGRVRVFDGRDFLGESLLEHTPEGAEVRLETGTAFDLAAERERTAFSVDRAGRSMSESFTITLRNAKDAPARVVVVEPVPRWSDWDITQSSVPAKKRDAHHARFELEVPARGEAQLAYTARYRWPAGVQP